MKYDAKYHNNVVMNYIRAYEDEYGEAPDWLSDSEIWSIAQKWVEDAEILEEVFMAKK
jgi:hypothetical protein